MAHSYRNTRLVFVIHSIVIATVSLVVLAVAPRRVGREPGALDLMKAYGSEETTRLPFARSSRQLREAAADTTPVRALWSPPSGYQATTYGARLTFAQVADGIMGQDRCYQTTLMLVNDSDYDASGMIRFYDDSGAPLVLTLGGVTGSSIPLAIAKGGNIRRLVTSRSDSLKTGWASIETDQPITGTASFGIRDAAGTVYSDVGAPESLRGEKFTIFADTMGTGTTGLALANPDSTNGVSIRIELVDANGTKIRETTQYLPANGHIARFLEEWFAQVAGIGEFEGSLVVSSTDGRKFAGLTLRMDGIQFTSLPMVTPPPADSTKTRLSFPQIADGLLGQLRYVSSVILINNTAERATGKVDFLQSDGKLMNVTIGIKTASIFDFDLAPGGVKRMTTGGAGTANVGWARVSMDKPISGTAVFYVLDARGTTLAQVGVNSAEPISHPALQVPLFTFTLDYFGVDRTLSGLATETVVGSYKQSNQSGSIDTYSLKMKSSEADKTVIAIVYPNDSTTWYSGLITVTKIAGGLNLAFSFGSQNSAPTVHTYAKTIELSLTGFPVQLAATGKGMSAIFTIQSGPADLGDMSTALQTVISNLVEVALCGQDWMSLLTMSQTERRSRLETHLRSNSNMNI